MALPPEDPTQPLPPVDPRHRVAYRETEVIADDGAWRQMILDRLDSVRTAVTVIGLIAVVALAIAVWALLRAAEADRERGGTRGASSAQIDDLRDRIDDVESDVRNAASKGDVAAAQRSAEELSGRVDELSGRATGSGADNAARESLNDLSDSLATLNESVTALDRRVAALEAGQAP